VTELARLHDSIRACTRCVESGHIPAAKPLTLGRDGASVFVIGQAPSRLDHETGQFYEGPAGRRLKQWLQEAGFTESDFGTTIYAAALTKCFPGRRPGSSTDRAPSRAELAQCRGWLDAELALVNPRIVVLFGSMAIQTFLPKAPLEERVGTMVEQDGRLWVPLPHSSGASLWLNAPENQVRLRDAICLLAQLRVREGIAPSRPSL
jgi:uracil-DNA glycosylase family 4